MFRSQGPSCKKVSFFSVDFNMSIFSIFKVPITWSLKQKCQLLQYGLQYVSVVKSLGSGYMVLVARMSAPSLPRGPQSDQRDNKSTLSSVCWLKIFFKDLEDRPNCNGSAHNASLPQQNSTPSAKSGLRALNSVAPDDQDLHGHPKKVLLN
jgi:hypothetical protein